jgi:hypothetical protein
VTAMAGDMVKVAVEDVELAVVPFRLLVTTTE